MALEKSFDDNDNVLEQGNFKVVISKDYDNMYNNLEIDFVDNYMGKGFSIADKGADGCSSCSSCG